VRITDFNIAANLDPVGVRLNHAVSYLSERVYLELARSKVQGDYGKLVISLVRSGLGHTHGLVTLVKPICEVHMVYGDLSALLGDEPTRRSAAMVLVEEALSFVVKSHPQGASELLEICRSAWASPPPYRVDATRRPIRRGRLTLRLIYEFGPASTKLELETEERGEITRSFVVRQANRFVPWSDWVPARVRNVPDGLIFEDRSGHEVDLIRLP
jgi:hypothetical protein